MTNSKEKILVINAGSSSLKFSLFEMPEEKEIAHGSIGRIGENLGEWKLVKDDKRIGGEVVVKDHSQAFEIMINKLISTKSLNLLEEVSAIGHRILHGGEIYKDSTIIDDKVINDIQELSKLGPLHHPGELAGIDCSIKQLPNATNVGVFDTAFHQTIPEINYLYAVPYEWYQQYGIRKYGFHGTSHKYITESMQEKLGKKDVNLIICHIGSGASITAIKNGKSYDTTMGLTPEAGLVMCTRAGDIDPSILEYVCKESGKSISEITNELNQNSGILGISGISNDYRDVEEAYLSGNKRAYIAIKKMTMSAAKFIIDFIRELDGYKNVDGIVFTAGVGENASLYRDMVIKECSKLLPLSLSDENEKIAGFKDKHEGIISDEKSLIPIYAIPANEEIMIARDTYNLTHQKKLVK